jgi:hypothetical protein
MNNHFGGKAVTNALMLEGMLQNRLGVAFPSATALPLAQAKLPIGPSF